jgi:hypothetical protein
MSNAADYYSGSAVPPTTAYGPPKIDFSALTGGLDTFVKGRQEGREEDTATAFRNGIPMVKDANGNDTLAQRATSPSDVIETLDRHLSAKLRSAASNTGFSAVSPRSLIAGR